MRLLVLIILLIMLFSRYVIFGITDLAFGVELNNLEKLHQMKNLLLMDAYNEQVKIHLDLGNSFNKHIKGSINGNIR